MRCLRPRIAELREVESVFEKDALKWLRATLALAGCVASEDAARGKTIVFGLLKRGGKADTQVVENGSVKELFPISKARVSEDSVSDTDGFKTCSLWTRQAVQLLFQQHFGIEMTPVSAGRYLKAWEFTPQKPIRRAYERNVERVRSGLGKNIRRSMAWLI